MKQHRRVRAAFAVDGIEIPWASQKLEDLATHTLEQDWYPLYSAKEHDLIVLLHEQHLMNGVDYKENALRWDFSAQADHQWIFAPQDAGKVPCFSKYNSELGRHYIGSAHMLMHGFPSRRALETLT